MLICFVNPPSVYTTVDDSDNCSAGIPFEVRASWSVVRVDSYVPLKARVRKKHVLLIPGNTFNLS